MTVHPLEKMTIDVFSLKVFFASFLTISLSFSPSVLAQPADAAVQQWWFDVEVILFKRDFDPVNVSEKFKQSQFKKTTNDYLDLLTPYLKPDLSYLRAGLPYCRASNREAIKTQYERSFAFPFISAETNASPLLQQDQQLDQPLTGKGLSASSDDLPAQNFEYEVATMDRLSQSDDTQSLTRSSVPKGAGSSNLVQINSADLEHQTNKVVATKTTLANPPIDVEFIEWQIPSEFLCAYAEQIDPSFASLILLQNDALKPQPKNQIMRIPQIINGIEWQQKRSAFLLPTSNMQMSELYEKINKQRDITPLLHINWRQEVKFGRENGQTLRLIAGENFADEYDANGLPLIGDTNDLFESLNQPKADFYIPEEELSRLTPQQQQSLLEGINGEESEGVVENLFARITSALADNTPFNIDEIDETNKTAGKTVPQIANTETVIHKELWQLDGTINVYLRNVGRVPYLHIDSNLDFRHPLFDPTKAQQLGELSTDPSSHEAIMKNAISNKIQQPNFLQRANFNQLRRVISQQVHYFDHPLFGMVVRINRYRWPEVPRDGLESVSQDN